MTYAEPVNMTNVMDMFVYTNSVTDDIFGIGIIIALYLIILMYLNGRGEPFGDCAIVAGFVSSIAAILVFLGGLITAYHMFAVFFVSALSMFLVYWNKS